MDDLVEWLPAQLDEDERSARELLDENAASRVTGLASTLWDEEDADAQRVLREVEAKRLMLAELEQLPHYAWDGRDEYGCPKYTDPEAWRDLYGEGVEQVCNCGRDAHVERQRRLLALPLADRPSYQEEWRP